MKQKKSAGAFLCIWFITLIPVCAESTIVIEPYTKEEFPLWAQDLRRYEIISLGSLPFVLVIAGIGYDTYRYFESGMNPAYAPSPFVKKTGEAALSQNEQQTLFFMSLGISALIGVVDFVITQVERNNIKTKNQTLIDSGDGNIIITEEAREEMP